MQPRNVIPLCFCFFVASCSDVTLEGNWQCNEIVVERDQFTAYGDSSIQYLDDGTFLEEFNITYDFAGIGKVSARVLQPGSWRLDSDILIKEPGLISIPPPIFRRTSYVINFASYIHRTRS